VEILRPRGISITISVGMACSADHPGINLTRLLALADKALYAAKEAGRNCIYLYTPKGAERLFEPAD
jgi:diguanylate cyclase (GGDEF)-like protein